MGQRLSKKQRIALREKHKRKKVKRYESMDAKGISRKKFKLVIKPKTFFIMKLSGIIAIPVVYFVYSPLLIFVMLYFVGLFFAAIGCEHSLNKSVIRSNHIKIPKYDSAIALILVSIAIFGSSFSAARGKVGMFANTVWMKISQAFRNTGSLLTGFRSILGKTRKFGFGSMDKPDGFIPNSDDFKQQFSSDMTPPDGFSAKPPQIDFNMDNVPVEFMFSQVLSTVTTVLIIAVGVMGAISLYTTFKKIKKFNQQQNEVIVDGAIMMLDEEQIDEILDFGEIEED